MTTVVEPYEQAPQTEDLRKAPLADLRDTRDTALSAAIARVIEEAAEPTAVAAGWSSAT